MKKLLYLLLSLVFISSNLLGCSFLWNKQLINILYTNNQKVHIDYSKTNTKKDTDFVDHLIKFSKEKNINISQYNFLSEDELNIYSTNIKDDPTIHLKSGKFPEGLTYISNENLETKNAKQSGVFSFPLSNWRVHIYDIQQVKNVGLGNEFYLSGTNNSINNAFIKEFSSYGDISLINEPINSFLLINISLFMIVIFSFIIFFLGMVFFLIFNRKMLFLQELWGYSKRLALASILKLFLRFSILIMFFLLFGWIVFTVLFDQTYFLIEYMKVFAVTNVITASILLFFTLLAVSFIQKYNDNSVNIKGKLPFEKILLISSILKAVTTIILFFVISSSIFNFYHLSKKIDSLDYWNQTQNVYKIQVGPLDEDINTNLEKDRDLNNRLLDFYKEIGANNEAFLMVSENFHIVGYDKGEPIYSFTLNVSEKDNVYSPNGRKITIDKNYLNINPIKSSNGGTILEQVKEDEDTLNILVPEQLRTLENQIIHSYKEWFYFQKVSVDNIYNKELGNPLNKKTIEDLKINIIYTIAGQDYFTFNSATGNSQNKIRDPIAVIYNESVDTSTIGAYATTSLFFLDNSQGNAFENILPSIKNTNVPEINHALSVYNEANNQIIEQQWLLFQQMMGLIITLVLSGILLTVMIWAYYHANISQLNIKYLFGYSSWKRNKSIILTTILSNIVSGLLVYLVYGNSIIIAPMVGFVLIIDLFVLNVLSNNLSKKGIKKG